MLNFSPAGIYLIVFLLLTGCASHIDKEPKETWIDVRSETEYQESFISGHANIPHTEITDKISQLVDDKDTPIYLYCGSGRRRVWQKRNWRKWVIPVLPMQGVLRM